jgi:two-component system response regulator HydG
MDRQILIIDDDRSMCEVLEAELRRREFDVSWVTSPQEALARFETQDFGLVVTDMNMADMSGVELCKQLLSRREDMPVIVITAFANMETAIAAIRAGAYDFVTKPFDMDELALTIERGLKHRALREEVKRLRKAVDETQRFDEILGTSAAILKMCELVARVADTETTVLVTGESGTGKELVAKALHAKSGRKEGPFVAINCAAMPEPLLESELFGHTKGAFTGAVKARPGLFREADGGTILLDEIGELPAPIQAKLLRVLQEGEVRPVGEDQSVKVDVRIIAATHRDLMQMAVEGKFREDLFYRLKVVHLRIPPLRERPEDIPPLARHFLAEFSRRFGAGPFKLTPSLLEQLNAYSWPGNIRELENAIESLVALSQGGEVDLTLLPQATPVAKPMTEAVATAATAPDLSTGQMELKARVDAYERGIIVNALEAAHGNRSHAARALGINRATLHGKLRKYGLTDSDTDLGD